MPKMSKKKGLNSKDIPEKPGLYALSISAGGKSIDAYAGQTKNLRRRIREHRRGKLAGIDQRRLRVRYRQTRNPEVKERVFINNLKKRGAWLGLNKIKGSSSRSRVSGSKTSKTKRAKRN